MKESRTGRGGIEEAIESRSRERREGVLVGVRHLKKWKRERGRPDKGGLPKILARRGISQKDYGCLQFFREPTSLSIQHKFFESSRRASRLSVSAGPPRILGEKNLWGGKRSRSMAMKNCVRRGHFVQDTCSARSLAMPQAPCRGMKSIRKGRARVDDPQTL